MAKQHEPVAEWSDLSRAQVTARIAEGRWLLYFYAQAYCATDCVAVADFARRASDYGVAELCPSRQPSWAGAFPRLPVVQVLRDGQVVATLERGPLTLEALEALVSEAEDAR